MKQISHSSFSRLSFFMLVIILMGIAVSIRVIRQNQDMRQKAAGGLCPGEPVSISLKRTDKIHTAEQNALLDKTTRNLTGVLRKNAASGNVAQNREQILTLARQRKQVLLGILQSSPDAAFALLLRPEESSRLSLVTDDSCAEQDTMREGTVTMRIADYADGTSSNYYVLHTADNTAIHLYFPQNQTIPFRSGQRIKVKGYAVSNALLVPDTGSAALTVSGTQTALLTGTTGVHPILSILISFTNTSPASTVNAVNTFVYTTINNFYKEASYNRISLTGNTMGVIQLPFAEVCNVDQIASAALTAVDATVDFRQYQHIIIHSPLSTCGNVLGLSSIGKETITTNDGTVQLSISVVNEKYTGNYLVAGHEFGHSLGVLHSSFVNCGSVSLSDNCQLTEYGDAYDIMGNGQGWHFNGLKKEDLNWFALSNIRSVTANGTYTIEPVETATGGVKVLKILRGSNSYMTVEYRQPVGADANSRYPDVYTGALVHLDIHFSGSGGGADTDLIDASPPGDVSTPVLHVGESMTDPSSGITIKTLSRDANGVTVQVSGIGGVISPTVTSVPTLIPTNTLVPTIRPTNTLVPTIRPTSTIVPTLSPSNTPLPSPTLVPNGVRAVMQLLLHGIGKAGDNVLPNSDGNMNPLHPQRTITVELYNANNMLSLSKQGIISYAAAAGTFAGSVDLGTVTAGAYTMKLASSQYLKKSVPGILTISSGQQITIQPVSMISGDVNYDNRLNILDYNSIADCFSDFSPAKNCSDPAKKAAADITDDGLVNQYDYNLFIRELSVQPGQ